MTRRIRILNYHTTATGEKMTKATIEKISPAKAREMLGMNHGNFRRPDHRRVNLYAQEMATGNWDCNGESIKMNGTELIDGQHRLRAIIKAGTTITTVVIRGLKSDGRTIDRGRPRTVAQWLGHEGIKNRNAVASMARLCVGYEKELWSTPRILPDAVTDSEMFAFIEANEPRMQDAIRIVNKSRSLIAPAISGAVLFFGSEGLEDIASNADVKWFFDSLTNGKMIDEDDAVYQLRKRLLSQSPQHRLEAFVKRSYMVIAWNKTVRGESCSVHQMRLRLTGPEKQALPTYIERINEVTK